jgi:uncharacterized membrane protein
MRYAQGLKGIGLSTQSLVNLMFKLLFLLSKTIELRLSHLNVAPLILAVIVVTFSRAKMNLTDTVMFHITAILLDHNVSKVIEEVGEFKTSGSTIASTDSRLLKSL